MQQLVGSNFKQQLWATMLFAIPLIGSNVAQSSKHLVDAIMLGRYGVDELAAGVLAGTMFIITFVVGSGFAMAAIPMAAEARGSGLTWKVRRIVRMSFWLSTLYWLILFVPLHYAEALFLMLGQQPEIAQLAGEYMTIALWGVFPAMTVMVLKSFFMALGKARVILWTTALGAIVNVPANYALVFGNWGAPELGIKGAAYATIAAHSLTLVVMVIYLLLDPVSRSYNLLLRFYRVEWKILGRVFTIGWPISATLISEIGLFAACSVMMGWIDTATLAAHGIALETAGFVFMVYLGFANASTAQVGFAVGTRSKTSLVLAAQAAIFLTTLTATAVMLIFLIFPEHLVRAFLDTESDEAAMVLSIGIQLLYLAAAFQIGDALQVVALGLLRGLSDTRIPMIIAVFSYAGVGLPVSYFLGFTVGMQGVGIWCGFIAGLAAAAILLLLRFHQKTRTLNFTESG